VYLWFYENKAKGVRGRKQNTIVMTIFLSLFTLPNEDALLGFDFVLLSYWLLVPLEKQVCPL
jgi:hypothetical protein